MSECDFCKKDIITSVGSRWDQTGVEVPLEGDQDKIVKLCWDCYFKFMNEK